MSLLLKIAPCLLTLAYGQGEGQVHDKIKARINQIQLLGELFPPVRMVKLEQHENHLIADVDQAFILKDHIVIFDTVQRQVLLYDIDGTFLMPLGRTGNGPGEYQSPQSITPIWGDQIAIKSVEGRLTVYGLDGELKFQLFESHGIHLPRGAFAWPKKDRFYVTDFYEYGQSNSKFNLIVDMSDIETPKYLSTFEDRDPFPKEYGWRIAYTNFYLAKDRIYSSTPYSSRVNVFDLNGKKVNSFPLGTPEALDRATLIEVLKKKGRDAAKHYYTREADSITKLDVVNSLLLINTMKGLYIFTTEGERLSKRIPSFLGVLTTYQDQIVSKLPLASKINYPDYYTTSIAAERELMNIEIEDIDEDDVWLRFGALKVD